MISSDFCIVFMAIATIWCFWSTSALIYTHSFTVNHEPKEASVKIGLFGGILYTGALYGLTMFVVLLFGG